MLFTVCKLKGNLDNFIIFPASAVTVLVKLVRFSDKTVKELE